MRWRKVKKGGFEKPKFVSNAPLTAPVVVRVKAFIIDLFMIYMPILYIVTYALLDGKDDFQNNQFAILGSTLLFGLILCIFQKKSGQTPGSKAYDIILIDELTGEKASFLKAVMRYLSFLIAGGVIFGLLLAPFRKDGKNLHDIISKTKLVLK